MPDKNPRSNRFREDRFFFEWGFETVWLTEGDEDCVFTSAITIWSSTTMEADFAFPQTLAGPWIRQNCTYGGVITVMSKSSSHISWKWPTGPRLSRGIILSTSSIFQNALGNDDVRVGGIARMWDQQLLRWYWTRSVALKSDRGNGDLSQLRSFSVYIPAKALKTIMSFISASGAEARPNRCMGDRRGSQSASEAVNGIEQSCFFAWLVIRYSVGENMQLSELTFTICNLSVTAKSAFGFRLPKIVDKMGIDSTATPPLVLAFRFPSKKQQLDHTPATHARFQAS